MAIEDYIDLADLYYGDEFEDEYYVTCKYCGMNNLRWETEKGKWILMELDKNLCEKKHNCKIVKKEIK